MGIWDKFYEKARCFFSAEEGEGGSKTPKKRCYYDLLEVSRDSSEDEIKRAFKKLALKWHPDKNPGREEECAAYFVLIQQAYEVLMDPQERAFYDRHRENIIYANSDEGPDERKDTGISLVPFMSPSCWRSALFSNEEERSENFYSVYRELFHKISAEEYAYVDDPEDRNFPVFGKFTSDYDTVVSPFYGFWLDFTTRRSFAWLDKWNLLQAPDRNSARAMERENRKLREFGRKQRSEEVRKLVEFVRKHDKRVELAKQRQKERNAEIQKRVEQQRLITIRRNLENMKEAEVNEEAHREHLMHLEEIESALDAEFGTAEATTTTKVGSEMDGEGEEGEEDDGLNCIVCDKSFKNRKVLESHQRSKKHKQMVELLRAHMREEDQLLFEEKAQKGIGEENNEDEEEDNNNEMMVQQRRGKRRKRKNGRGDDQETKEEENEKGEEKELEETKGGEEEQKEAAKEKEKKTAVEKGKKGKQQQKKTGAKGMTQRVQWPALASAVVPSLTPSRNCTCI